MSVTVVVGGVILLLASFFVGGYGRLLLAIATGGAKLRYRKAGLVVLVIFLLSAAIVSGALWAVFVAQTPRVQVIAVIDTAIGLLMGLLSYHDEKLSGPADGGPRWFD